MKKQRVRIVAALGLMSLWLLCLVSGDTADALPNVPKSPFDNGSVPVFSGGEKIGEAAGNPKDFREDWKKDPPRPSQQQQQVGAAHGDKPVKEEDEKDDKEKEKKPDSPEEKVEGAFVNGQQLYKQVVDGKEYRYYYLDGKTDSPFISYQQESGSFKWTTKDAMLGIDKGGYREYGSVQLQDGTLTKMYQLDDGSVKFKNGSDWFGSNSPGEGATYGRVNGNFAGEDGFAGNLPKDGSMKLSQDPALARPSTGDIGTQPQPSSIGGQQGSFNNPGMPSGSGSFGGFTPQSAMQEFLQSPYGANSPGMHSSMNSFLNGLSPDGFNRFMVDAAETARANGYYPNGTLCVGCGMGHLYKQSRRNYQ